MIGSAVAAHADHDVAHMKMPQAPFPGPTAGDSLHCRDAAQFLDRVSLNVKLIFEPCATASHLMLKAQY